MRRLVLVFLLGCTAEVSRPDSGNAPDAGPLDATEVDAGNEDRDSGFPVTAIPAAEQRPGDPAAGYDVLVNSNYVGCGVPHSAWQRVAGPAPQNLRLPGRTGLNETLQYDFNAFTTASGVTVV